MDITEWAWCHRSEYSQSGRAPFRPRTRRFEPRRQGVRGRVAVRSICWRGSQASVCCTPMASPVPTGGAAAASVARIYAPGFLPRLQDAQVRWCVQQRLARSAGDSPAKVKARSPVAWMAGRRETNDLKPIDRVIVKDDCESPGRSASERIGGPENERPRRPSPQP